MKDDTPPLVSIGMPVLNCQETITESINSILGQSYINWELLLIDDGSKDRTCEIALSFKDPRIKVISDGETLGLATRLNQAIGHSSGQYFARMDGDDIAYPNRLQLQVSYLEGRREIDLVGSWALVFGKSGIPLGKRTGPEQHGHICAKPYAGFPIMHPTYCGRTSWFSSYGYRTDAIRCEDQDLLLRSYRRSQFAIIPCLLLGYREENLQLGKILRGRWHYSKTIIRELHNQQKDCSAIPHVAAQGLKGLLDILAISTRLNYLMLAHRARPVTEPERLAWENVIDLVNKGERGLAY